MWYLSLKQMGDIMTDLQQQAVDTVNFYIDLANEVFNRNLPKIPVNFNLRGRVAGMCRTTLLEAEIRLNRVLLEENGQAFLDRTPGHEVAHYVTYRIYGPRCKPHGREWKHVMGKLGLDSTRCHSFDTSNSRCVRRRQQRYEYTCGCRSHNLSQTRHNKVMRGFMYRCKFCKGSLTYTGLVKNAA